MENVMQQKSTQSEWYFHVPYDFFKRGLKASACTMLAAVRSLTTPERKPQISFRTFAEKLSLSTSTVAANIKALTDSGELEQNKTLRSAAKYTYTGATPGKGYITVDAFLFGKEFKRRIYDKKTKMTYYVTHKLTDAEVYVLSLIDSYKIYEAGQAAIATTLGYSKRTVLRSIKALSECFLIYSKQGKSKKDRGKLWAHKSLLRELRGKLRKAKKVKKDMNITYTSQAVKDANARIDAGRAEWERKEKARRLEERLDSYLLKIPEYKAARVEYDAKMPLYRAALKAHDDATADVLNGRLDDLNATMDAIKARVIVTGEYLNTG